MSLLLTLLVAVPQPSPVSAASAPFGPGHVFAAIGNGLIQHYDGAGTLLDTLDTGLGGFTTGCAFDSAGNLYVTAFTAGTVVRFRGPDLPHANLGSFGSGYSGHIETIVFDAAGHVYVGAVDGDNDIRKFDAHGNLVAQFDVAIERRGSDWIVSFLQKMSYSFLKKMSTFEATMRQFI